MASAASETATQEDGCAKPEGDDKPSTSSTQDSDAQSLDNRIADVSKFIVEQENAAAHDQAMNESISKMRAEISEGYTKLAAIGFWEDRRGPEKEALKELLRKWKEYLENQLSIGLCTEHDLTELAKCHEEFKREKENILLGLEAARDHCSSGGARSSRKKEPMQPDKQQNGSLDIAKSDNLLKPLEALPGYVAHTVGNLAGGVSLGLGWALGKADTKLGRAEIVSDSRAFKAGFRTWLYANGVWPTVLCETGPYGTDIGPLPQDRAARRRMLRQTPLIVSNHVSYLDTVVLPLVLDVPKLMAMKEVASWPLFGQLCQEMDMIWVDRSSSESRKAAREAIVEHAKVWQSGDRALLMWPEGTTSNGYSLKDFKTGAFETGCSIRPVLIKYTGEWDPSNVNLREAACEGGDGSRGKSATEQYGDLEWAQQFLGHIIHSCTVLICRPYNPNQAEKDDPELYKENLRKLMLERLNELHAKEETKKKQESSSLWDAATSRWTQLLG